MRLSGPTLSPPSLLSSLVLIPMKVINVGSGSASGFPGEREHHVGCHLAVLEGQCQVILLPLSHYTNIPIFLEQKYFHKIQNLTFKFTHTFPSLVPLDPLRPPAPLNCRLVHADYKFCYKTKHISIILLTSFCHVTMGYITS